MSAHKTPTAVSEQMVNGVDVTKVKNTVAAVEQEPGLAKFTFRLSNEWLSGGYNRSTVGDFHGADEEHTHGETFQVEADEHQVLAGTDQAPNPVEYVLHALAGCLTSTLVYHAAVRDIRIDELECQVEGDIDLRGFLGISDEVRKGYQNIRVKYRVKTDADNIDKLRALSKLSPVYDTTANGTNVDIQIERK